MITNMINIIGRFLAVRDIDALKKEELIEKFQIEKVDMLLLLGNSILYTMSATADAYKMGLCDKIMIAGGIGHSTEILRNNVLKDNRFKNISVKGKSEADIFYSILVDYYEIPPEKIIIENKSTNCGSNALEALKIIKAQGLNIKTIILMQDPIMQLRTYAAFKKIWKGEDTIIINFSPFIPILKEDGSIAAEGIENIDGIWDRERFLSLVMGEIPRLKDDKDGYGPNGRNFIAHVDIPDEVLNSYKNLEEELIYYTNLRNY